MRDKFTVEEINLMCIFGTDNRAELLNDLTKGLLDIYDTEMIEIFGNVIKKLETLTDEEFEDIGFHIADDFFDEFTDGED